MPVIKREELERFVARAKLRLGNGSGYKPMIVFADMTDFAYGHRQSLPAARGAAAAEAAAATAKTTASKAATAAPG